MMASLVCIDPARVAEFWPLCRDMILSAITRTGLSHPRELEASLLSGGSLLWIALSADRKSIEAAVATQVKDTDASRVCELLACGGSNRAQWLPLLRQIEDYARAEGCSRMRAFGRKGWLRVLSGYSVAHVVLERPL
jgi:hypothetical protein